MSAVGPRIDSRAMRRVISVALFSTALLVAPSARAQTLTGALANNVTFPQRTIVLSVPQSVAVGAGQVHVAENSRSVRQFTVNSLKQANPGELGVVLVIDSDPSMSGAPLGQAMVAARALAAQRSGNQQLGAIFGDGTELPLTTNQQLIDRFLARPPRIVQRTNLLGATESAITQLKAANIVAGAVIYVSDDIDRAPGLTPRSLAAIANAAHVRIFTVAVRDAATSHPGPFDLPLSSMRVLAQSAGGTFSEAIPAQLQGTFTEIENGLTSQYVVHYRSKQGYGQRVTLSVRVDAVPGSFTTTYTSPPPPHATAARSNPRPRSFWASTLALVAVAFGCAILFGLAVAFALSHFAHTGELRSRVQAFVPPPQEIEVVPGPGPPAGAGILDLLLARWRWWPSFVEQVDISDIGRTAKELASFGAAASLLAALLIEAVTGSLLLSLLGLAVGPLVIRALVRRSVRKQRLRFMEQLPGTLHEIAGAMRTGRSIGEAVEVVADTADEPMRRELQRALADERAGMQLEAAIRPIGERMDSAEIEQVSVVAALHRRSGANITEVLDRMADTARQRVEIRRELLTLTAQARLSRNVLMALPVFVVVAVDLIGHTYEKPLFHTTAGLAVLAVGAAMVATGAWVMKKIVNIEE
jgi:tight adherence protein B